jgi:hypothetical protein
MLRRQPGVRSIKKPDEIQAEILRSMAQRPQNPQRPQNQQIQQRPIIVEPHPYIATPPTERPPLQRSKSVYNKDPKELIPYQSLSITQKPPMVRSISQQPFPNHRPLTPITSTNTAPITQPKTISLPKPTPTTIPKSQQPKPTPTTIPKSQQPKPTPTTIPKSQQPKPTPTTIPKSQQPKLQKTQVVKSNWRVKKPDLSDEEIAKINAEAEERIMNELSSDTASKDAESFFVVDPADYCRLPAGTRVKWINKSDGILKNGGYIWYAKKHATTERYFWMVGVTKENMMWTRRNGKRVRNWPVYHDRLIKLYAQGVDVDTLISSAPETMRDAFTHATKPILIVDPNQPGQPRQPRQPRQQKSVSSDTKKLNILLEFLENKFGAEFTTFFANKFDELDG